MSSLTLSGTVGEERYEQRHVVDVLQVRTDVLYALWQICLQVNQQDVLHCLI